MSGSKTSTSTSNTSTNYPDWTQSAGQQLFNQASDYFRANPTRPTYSGPLTADFGSGFGSANDYLSGVLGQTNPDTTSAQGTIQSVLNGLTPGASTSSYMSPYIAATLQPTLDQISQQGDTALANNGAAATSAGAFGDTGHALLNSLIQKNTQQNLAGATAGAYNTAFGNAQTQANTVNNEAVSGANTLNTIGTGTQTQQDQIAQLLATLGSTQQQAGQTGITNALSQFNLGANYPLQGATSLAAILNSLPKNTTGTSTGTQTTPDNSALGLAGSLLSFAL